MTEFLIMQKMFTLNCADCGLWFGMPKDFEERRRKDHVRFYCPVGHVNYYGAESDEEKFRRERDNARQQLARVEEEKQAALRTAERAKAETKKLKKRAAAGVCPCCQRSFSNMTEHMKKQHPKFVAAEIDNVVALKKKA